MGFPASQSKGPRYSFQPLNLRAIAARFMCMCQDFSKHFRVGNRDVSNEARVYLSGLVMKAPRKNIERMEEYVEGSDYECTQHFVSESPWSHREVLDHVARDVDTAIGGEESDLLIDESGFSKKGDKSVGVARQYNGRLGKVDNCQVGVFGALSDGARVSLIDARLYLPENWAADAQRCKNAGIPEEERVFRTKPDLGLAIIDNAKANGIRFGCVSFDGFYGNVPQFIEGLFERETLFVGAVHKDLSVYERHPQPYLPRRKTGKGRMYTQYRCREKAVRVDELDAGLTTPWRLITVREGTKGYVGVYARRRRVWIWQKGASQAREVWLVILKDPFNNQIQYYISNYAPKTTLTHLVRKAAHRYYIERTFQDAKTSLGMANYQVRVWNGWHHHMAMVSLALLFMLNERLLNEKDITLLSCQDIVELLNYYLPRADKTEDAIFKQLEKRHKKRQKSIESAYKIQLEKNPNLGINLTK
jgi:SRSO17 transposase